MATNLITKSSGTFDIHPKARLQLTKIGQSERLINHIKLHTLLIPTRDREAHTVNGNRCSSVKIRVSPLRHANLDPSNSLMITDLCDFTQSLHNACEH